MTKVNPGIFDENFTFCVMHTCEILKRYAMKNRCTVYENIYDIFLRFFLNFLIFDLS